MISETKMVLSAVLTVIRYYVEHPINYIEIGNRKVQRKLRFKCKYRYRYKYRNETIILLPSLQFLFYMNKISRKIASINTYINCGS